MLVTKLEVWFCRSEEMNVKKKRAENYRGSGWIASRAESKKKNIEEKRQRIERSSCWWLLRLSREGLFRHWVGGRNRGQWQEGQFQHFKLKSAEGEGGGKWFVQCGVKQKKNPVGVSFLKNEKWPAKCFKSVLSCLGQKAEQSPWVVRDPCLQSLCLCGDKINSFQRDALCTSLSCRHTLPGLGVETSPSSKLSANRPPSPFCTCAVDVLWS